MSRSNHTTCNIVRQMMLTLHDGQLRPRLCPNAVSIQWAWKGCPHCVIAQSSPSLALSKQIGQQTDATMGNLYSYSPPFTQKTTFSQLQLCNRPDSPKSLDVFPQPFKLQSPNYVLKFLLKTAYTYMYQIREHGSWTVTSKIIERSMYCYRSSGLF